MLQVILPFIALEIRSRIEKHGIKMEESPYFSVINVSPFWREAREINKRLNDERVNLLLQFRYLFLIIAFTSFFAIAAFSK